MSWFLVGVRSCLVYVKASTRKTRDGQTIRYLQLAHNEWDPVAKASKTRVLYSFGREDQLDVAGVRRLVDALSRLLDPAEALAAAAPAGLSFVESRPLGGAWLLDGLWRWLRIDKILQPLVGSARREVDVERVLFALVANRALAPSSKLAAAEWVCQDVHLPGLPHVTDDACYRAMDQLIEVEPALTRAVYDQIADLLNLEVDLLFFDTTSTYFELDEADELVWRDETGKAVAEGDPAAVKQAGFRTHDSKSKDSRDDLPQVVVGMAVTRTGIPVRVWCWPGNTSDSALIRQVKTDMREWSLARIVWVADRGFASAENRRFLQQGAGGYILGEKLRAGTAEADAALARQGRYATVADNLQVKEVNIGADDRFVICFNPEAAERDAAMRETADRPAHRQDRRFGHAERHETRRATRGDLHQARPQPLFARHPRRPAAHRSSGGQGRAAAGRQVPAALLRPEAVRRGHRPGLQAAPRSRTRLARHEDHPGPAAGVPPPRGPHPRPHPAVLAGAATHPRRRDHHRLHLGQDPR